MATFRDLALDADKDLIAATDRVGVLSLPDAAQIAGELAMLSRICGRILDDTLDGYGPGQAIAEDARWRSATRSVRSGIRSAEKRLERAAAAYGPKNGHVPARALGPSGALNSAIRRLGLAEEILQAELTHADPGHRRLKHSGVTGLGDRGTVREITGLAGRWIGLVGAVADGIAGQIQIPHMVHRVDIDPMPEVLRQAAGSARHARAALAKASGPATRISRRLAELPSNRAGSAHEPEAVQVPVNELLVQAREQAAALRAALNTPRPARDALNSPDGHDTAINRGEPGTPNGPEPSAVPAPIAPISPMPPAPPQVSARSLRYIATSAGSVHAATAIIARQLAARVAELAGPATPEYRALANAADALIETGRTWHTAARGWDHITTTDPGPYADTHGTGANAAARTSINRGGKRGGTPGTRKGAGTAPDAATYAIGTVMRLGLAAYADPDWTPTSPNTQVRPAAEFAATLDDVRAAAGHLGDVLTACTGAARASNHAITTLAAQQALLTPHHGRRGNETGTEPPPARPADVARLRDAYDAVLHRAATAERHLRAVCTQTVRNPKQAPALAAADFPNQPLAQPGPASTSPAARPAVTSGPVPASAVRPVRRTR